jgi:hypothetical protein
VDQFNRRRRLQYAAASLSVESDRKSGNYQRSNDEPTVLGTKLEEEKMAHAQYFIVRDQGQWNISLNGVHYGPYATQRDAVRAAVDAAHEAGLKGLNGQVLLRDQFRIEWTYGKDPYPPNSSDFL